MSKPGLPQGTRDFSANVVRKRNYIFHTIRSVFELYGFQPLETPAMENLDTLMGKYGEEGDKLIFKILNNGEYLTGLRPEDFEGIAMGSLRNIPFRAEINLNLEDSRKKYSLVTKSISSRALRYDLTIPFARYIAMNYGQLTMPFKRYQIQPVWRADRPQKGRYREFYQCDADVVGSKSLLNEVELASIYSQVFEQLGVSIEIRINNRKILAALAELCGGSQKMMDITIAIDKLDKIGIEKVKEELVQKGLTETHVNTIEEYLSIQGNDVEKLNQLKKLIGNSETGLKGIEEIEYILNYEQPQTPNPKLQTDFTLARGLNYYTGIIFEVKAMNIQMGSIGGGGRYDDLTGLFGVADVPGVGISFGVDRIYDVMEELNLFPEDVHAGTQVLFFNLGETESRTAFVLMQQLRAKGIRCELFHENTKFDRQFKYADKKQIQYAIIIGSKETEEGTCVVKNLKDGLQTTLAQTELSGFAFS